MKDIKIKDVSLVTNVTGNEKIPVSNGSGKPAAITVNLILDKVDLSNYATTETLNLAIQAINSNINGFNQSINSSLQKVNEKANNADATATSALNLAEGIQGNLSSFALKSELPDISNLATKDEIPTDYLTTIPVATADALGGVKKITVGTLAEDSDITTVVTAYNNLINKLIEAGLVTSLLEV